MDLQVQVYVFKYWLIIIKIAWNIYFLVGWLHKGLSDVILWINQTVLLTLILSLNHFAVVTTLLIVPIVIPKILLQYQGIYNQTCCGLWFCYSIKGFWGHFKICMYLCIYRDIAKKYKKCFQTKNQYFIFILSFFLNFLFVFSRSVTHPTLREIWNFLFQVRCEIIRQVHYQHAEVPRPL